MRAIYPNINGVATFSQGERDTPSHMNQYALDLMYNLYAPFDMKKVGDSRYKGGHQQYFESTSKIQLPNGKTDYVSMIAEHSADNPKIGTIFKKGNLVVKVGNVGTDPNAIHIHLVVGQGKVNKSLIGKYHNANSSGFEEPMAINIKSAKELFYAPTKTVWKYESKKVAFKKAPKGRTFEVWGLEANQYNAPVYIYSEKKEKGKVTRKQARKLNDAYVPKGYAELEILQTTNLNKDSNLNHIYKNKDGSNKQLKKGSRHIFKYIKTIEK